MTDESIELLRTAQSLVGTTGSLRFSEAVRNLAKLSPEIVLKFAQPLLAEAQGLIKSGQYDAARQRLIKNARDRIDEGMPLLAAFFLNGALSIQGYSGAVYASLGDAALAADCDSDAAQYYKTAGWLAMQVGDRPVVQRAVTGLEKVSTEDAWIHKARNWLGGEHKEGEPSCGFCRRPQSEVGPLIQGTQAAICSQCLRRLSSLQG